ncbi:MAG: AMIN domain-containing protein [Cyanobacteria bacterium J06638_28]
MKPRSNHKPKSSLGPWYGQSAIAVAGMMAVAAIVAPARATTLNDWSFDLDTRQLTIVLPAGIQPSYFILAEPARIVLNLPNTAVGEALWEQQYVGTVKSIRLSELPDATRIVVELAPQTLLDPRHAELMAEELGDGRIQWTLQPLLEDSTPVALAVMPAAEPLPEAVSLPDTEAPDTGVPIAVEPPFLPGSTVLPQAPETIQPATSGVVQVLSGITDPFAGVRTDAAALAGVGSEIQSDLPPEQIATAPFARSPQSEIAVPPLADVANARTPQVAVPSIATVPTVPAARSNAVPEEEAVPPNRTAPTEAIAIAPMSVPDLPPAPDVWRPDTSSDDATAIAAVPDNRVPPPPTAPSSQNSDLTEASPPTEPSSASSPSIEDATPQAVAIPIEPAPTAAPTPPTNSASVTPQPPVPGVTSPNSSPAPTAAGSQPPPFLSGTEAAPSAEQPTIPPPPTISPEQEPVPFGAPLTVAQAKAVSSSPPAAFDGNPGVKIPVGTPIVLQYLGTEPLTLADQEPWYEVLVVAEAVRHPETQAVLLAPGTQVLGRFEGFDDSGRRFVSQAIVAGSDRYPLLTESTWLLGSSRPEGRHVARNSGIGAVAVTALTSFSGVGLLGGAALGAASAFAGSPQVVTIQPGQVIESEVVAEILPFNNAPDIIQQPVK